MGYLEIPRHHEGVEDGVAREVGIAGSAIDRDYPSIRDAVVKVVVRTTGYRLVRVKPVGQARRIDQAGLGGRYGPRRENELVDSPTPGQVIRKVDAPCGSDGALVEDSKSAIG
jgi:hypothetical protein